MKCLRTLVAAVVCVFALPQTSDAAQQALSLSGGPANFFAAPDNDSLDKNLGSAFTVEAWINPAVNVADETTHPLNEYMILNKEDSYEIAIRNNDAAAEATFQAAIRVNGGSWDWTYGEPEGTVPANVWTHCAATYDGLVIRLFVNGKMSHSVEWPGPDGGKGLIDWEGGTSAGNATLKIGRRGRGGETRSFYVGLIDEVRISKVVRYTEAGFDVPKKRFTPDADTVALYHFDEASTAAADLDAVKAKFLAQNPPDDDGDGTIDLPATSEIKAVVKDAGPLGNHGVLVGTASLVPATGSPVSDAP
jgi:hypothetical protein